MSTPMENKFVRLNKTKISNNISTEMHFKKIISRLRLNYQWAKKKKKSRVAILISESLDFKKRYITTCEGQFVITKAAVHEEDIKI